MQLVFVNSCSVFARAPQRCLPKFQSAPDPHVPLGEASSLSLSQGIWETKFSSARGCVSQIQERDLQNTHEVLDIFLDTGDIELSETAGKLFALVKFVSWRRMV